MIPDVAPDSKSPPAYSSFHAPMSSPLSPPLITLTDVTQNGAVDKILYSDYESENSRYHVNGWCDAASSQSNPSSQMQYPKSSGSTEASSTCSLSTKNCLHGQTHKHISPQNLDTHRRDGFSSSVSNKRMATNDFQMQNGTLITNYENMNMDESKSHDQVGSVDFEKTRKT